MKNDEKYNQEMVDKIGAIKRQVTELGHEHLKTLMPIGLDKIPELLKPWGKVEKNLDNLSKLFKTYSAIDAINENIKRFKDHQNNQ